MRIKRMKPDESTFAGLYDVIVTLEGEVKWRFKRVRVDNDQWSIGNVTVTDESGQTTTFLDYEICRVEYHPPR